MKCWCSSGDSLLMEKVCFYRSVLFWFLIDLITSRFYVLFHRVNFSRPLIAEYVAWRNGHIKFSDCWFASKIMKEMHVFSTMLLKICVPSLYFSRPCYQFPFLLNIPCPQAKASELAKLSITLPVASQFLLQICQSVCSMGHSWYKTVVSCWFSAGSHNLV